VVELPLALYLTVFGGLLIVSVFLDRLAGRLRQPGVLLVLLLGLLVNNDPSGIPGPPPTLLSYEQADELAQVAVAVVLFQGGLTTNWHQLRAVVRPGLRLATLGSLACALLLMLLVIALEAIAPGLLPIPPGPGPALFIGAMLCSTDASAVLAVLRPLADRLPGRLIDLIDCESAFNDPMAVVLAGVALALSSGQAADGATLISDIVRQFLMGTMVGFLGGSMAIRLLDIEPEGGNTAGQAVVSLSVLLLLFGGTTLIGGSGLLAAYIAGLVIGNSDTLDPQALEQAYGGYLKLSELLLFLCMGLVVTPVAVVRLVPWIVLLFLALQLVRLLVVSPLLGTVLSRAEVLFVGLCGLRGAVPIALAIQAAARRDEVGTWGLLMPPLALGVVLLGLLLQGTALVPLARRLGLASTPAD
jgi:CPA1 family monovalent cation:H+ antiporter/cell volume regulation protein A